MATELEIKLRVDDHDGLRARLPALGGIARGRVLEVNHILDRADGSLRAGGAALRVRQSRPDDSSPRRCTLTYKGPVQPSRMKRRTELEVEVADADGVLGLLAALDFGPILVFEKRRDSWSLDDCLVELDELPFLGRFVEIEGPTEASIEEVQKRLGLANVPHVRQSYVSMLASFCTENGIGDRRVMFQT